MKAEMGINGILSLLLIVLWKVYVLAPVRIKIQVKCAFSYSVCKKYIYILHSCVEFIHIFDTL